MTLREALDKLTVEWKFAIGDKREALDVVIDFVETVLEDG